MTVYDWRAVEPKVLEFWEKEGIAKEITVFKKTSKKKKFYLLDGPPYANGVPHAGHLMTVVFKDVWGRFAYARGYQVWWSPGFDCHGLPIEVKVQEKLGLKTKEEVYAYGVDRFIEECKKFAVLNLTEWMEMYKKLGAWKGWLKPYLTYDNSYIESGWWTVKTLYEKGLMVRGEKPLHWCPRCETPLSGYEVTEEYAMLEDPSLYVKFKVRGKDEYILAWTTTPWTLPANVALLVHPEETYVRVEVSGESLILAEALLEKVMRNVGVGYKIVSKLKGKELDGLRYEPLIECPLQRELAKNEKAHRVYLSVPILRQVVAAKVAEKKDARTGVGPETFGHLVTMDVGTGVVHVAPGHGAEDNRVGEHYGLPVVSPVDEKGVLQGGTGFDGMYVKEADPKIVEYLRERGALFHHERYVHSYPLCWRCKTPLVYRLSKQWFLKIAPIKDSMLEANRLVRWLPEFARERMHNHLLEAPDWCISIQRFWGIPLPIWECNECGTLEVVGGVEELKKKMKVPVPLTDLHKHVVDKVELRCKCRGTMRRQDFLANVWVDSGIGPWASLGYPYYDKGLFKKLWKVDLVDESQDQIRGWFYALLFMGQATFGEAPYRTVCLNGWVVDEKGDPMSKSKGNYVEAWHEYKELGADLSRFYNCYTAAPWEQARRLSLREARELSRFMNLLANFKNFVEMYELDLGKRRGNIESIENRWIVSKTNQLVKEVTEDYENFRFHHAARRLYDFALNDLSRTYLKIAKEKTDAGEADEVAHTFGRVLDSYVRLLAPLCPFITEYLYQELLRPVSKKNSVHLLEWPKTGRVDKGLNENFGVLETLLEASYSLRQESKIGLRYPVRALVVSGPPELLKAAKTLEPVLKTMANVKTIEKGEEVLKFELKPNFASLGPKYGRNAKKVAEAIGRADAQAVRAQLQKAGRAKVGSYELEGSDVVLRVATPRGKAIETPFGWGVVTLDTETSPELEEESFVRELSRAVQQRRKEIGLKMVERVTLHVNAEDETLVMIKKWEEELRKWTGSARVVYNKPLKEARVCRFKDWTAEYEVVK